MANQKRPNDQGSVVARFLPIVATVKSYDRSNLVADLVAGLIVAIMLVPQAMAYAMLAGLPPQVGLYASILPLLLYSLFGSSNTLAVGPVAMVSLLVVSGVAEIADPGSPEFIGYCLTLALLAGVLQIAMSLFRFGFLVNFISHPVLVGFTSAAAIVIGVSQFKHILGITLPNTEYPWEMIAATFVGISSTNWATLAIGLTSVIVLVGFAKWLSPLLQKLKVDQSMAELLSKLGPLAAVMVSAIVVSTLALNQSANVNIVGDIPAGLPKPTMPPLGFDVIRQLLPLALVVTLVGYLESISVAKSLASKRREKVDANQELFALGIADVGAAFTGGYPVTGGFSRSMVNFSAGAKTPVAGMITALIVGISVALLTPAFFFIPKAVLGAIIVVAVAGLIDFRTPFKLWKYSRADAIALIVTFLAVLGLGIETGILIGIASTILMLMWKMSRPHVAEVGRMKSGLGFRNIQRHDVETSPGVFAVRVDESLNFANATSIEACILDRLVDQPEIKNVLLICSGINDIDATGLETLEAIHGELNELGVGFYLSDVKGPVTDRFKLAGFDESFLNQHIFLTTAQALDELCKSTLDASTALKNAADAKPKPRDLEYEKPLTTP